MPSSERTCINTYFARRDVNTCRNTYERRIRVDQVARDAYVSQLGRVFDSVKSFAPVPDRFRWVFVCGDKTNCTYVLRWTNMVLAGLDESPWFTRVSSTRRGDREWRKERFLKAISSLRRTLKMFRRRQNRTAKRTRYTEFPTNPRGRRDKSVAPRCRVYRPGAGGGFCRKRGNGFSTAAGTYWHSFSGPYSPHEGDDQPRIMYCLLSFRHCVRRPT